MLWQLEAGVADRGRTRSRAAWMALGSYKAALELKAARTAASQQPISFLLPPEAERSQHPYRTVGPAEIRGCPSSAHEQSLRSHRRPPRARWPRVPDQAHAKEPAPSKSARARLAGHRIRLATATLRQWEGVAMPRARGRRGPERTWDQPAARLRLPARGPVAPWRTC